jgi:hypothetical protein
VIGVVGRKKFRSRSCLIAWSDRRKVMDEMVCWRWRWRFGSLLLLLLARAMTKPNELAE